MTRYILLLALIALFFVQFNEALPATENVNLEERWDEPYYTCCYYYYKSSSKRGLEKRWENICEKYAPKKRSVEERNAEVEKRWGKPDYYCCYYYYDNPKRELAERNPVERWGDDKCTQYTSSKRSEEKRWDECKPKKRGLEKRWEPYCCCWEY